MGPKRQTGEQVVEVRNIHRQQHDPRKRSVRVGKPSAQADAWRAVAQARQVRVAYIETRVGIVALNREIRPVAEIPGSWRVAAGVDDNVTLRIHHKNGAQIFRAGRSVEEYLPAHVR